MNKTIAPYTLVFFFLLVVLFNANSVIVEALIDDDYSLYYEGLRGQLGTGRFSRSWILPFIHFLTAKLLIISPVLPRTILVLLMLLLSWMLFRFLNKEFEVPYLVCAVIVTLPQILPGQVLIPTFVMGSYPIYGLICLVASIWSARRYLREEGSIFLVLSWMCFFLTLEIITNPGLFLPYLVCSLFTVSERKTKVQLKNVITVIAGTIVLTGIRTIRLILNSAGATEVQEFDFALVLFRIIKAFVWSNPIFPEAKITAVLTLLTLILTLGYARFSKKNRGIQVLKRLGIRTGYLLKHEIYLLLAASWMIGTFLPFLISPWFTVRHAYPFTFGIVAVWAIVLSFWISKLQWRKNVLWYATLTFLILVGIFRHISINRFYDDIEKVNRTVSESLSKYPLTRNAQIILTGKTTALRTDGYWRWSSGFLEYATGRPDLTGLVEGPVRVFFDPIGVSKRNFDYQMSGINMDLPIYIFHCNSMDCQPLSYLLAVTAKDTSEIWRLYEVDQLTQKLQIVEEGIGISPLKHFILKNGLDARDIYGYEIDDPFSHSYTISERGGNEIEFFTQDPLSISLLSPTIDVKDYNFDNDPLGMDSIDIFASSNLIANNHFDLSSNSWTCWSQTGIGRCEWNDSDDSGYGSLLVDFKELKSEYGYVISQSWSSDASDNETYSLMARIVGSEYSGEIESFIRRSNPPYSVATNVLKLPFNRDSPNVGGIFELDPGNDQIRLEFQVQGSDGTIYLDDIFLFRYVTINGERINTIKDLIRAYQFDQNDLDSWKVTIREN